MAALTSVGFWLAIYSVWIIRNQLRDSRDANLYERALEWPQTEGVVESLKRHEGHIEVVYSYNSPAGQFLGSYAVNLGPDFGKGAAVHRSYEVTRMIKDYRLGMKVDIRYNPQNPRESILYAMKPPANDSA